MVYRKDGDQCKFGPWLMRQTKINEHLLEHGLSERQQPMKGLSIGYGTDRNQSKSSQWLMGHTLTNENLVHCL